MELSFAQRTVLNAAAARSDKLVTRVSVVGSPAKRLRLPGATLQKACADLLKRGLLAEFTGTSRDPDVLFVKTEFGPTEYAITPAGLRAIGIEREEKAEVPEPTPEAEEERAMQRAAQVERLMQRVALVEREIVAQEAAARGADHDVIDAA
jgi:hypothetical protein